MNDPRAAMGAALAPAALAPPIARALNLSKEATAGALVLLAAGAQPSFIARYRREQIGKLQLRDLERIQARAAVAAAFEFRRHQMMAELAGAGQLDAASLATLRAATEPADLDDLRSAGKRRKKGAAAAARQQGLAGLAALLWKHARKEEPASDVPLATDAPTDDAPTVAAQPAPASAPVDYATPPEALAEAYADKLGITAAEALAGARAICLDDIAHNPDVRRSLRALLVEHGTVLVGEGPGPGAKPGKGKGGSDKKKQKPQGPAAPAVEAATETETETEAPPSDEVAAPPGDAPAQPAVEGLEHETGPDPTDTITGKADGVQEPDAAEPAAPTPEPTADDPPPPSGPAAEPGSQADADPESAAASTQAAASDAATPGRKRNRTKKPKSEKKDRPNRHAKHVGREEPCAKIGSNTLLSLHRGEREGALTLDVVIEADLILATVGEALSLREGSPAAELMRTLALEAYQGPLGKAVKSGARRLLKQRIDRHAIGEYCEALRPLLLAPSFGPKPVLGIDPGHAPGCRIAVVDDRGRLIASDHVFPLQPKLQAPQAKARIAEMCAQFSVAAIAVTNGGGGRDVERLCREVVREHEGLSGVVVASVDADTAALYASSRISKDELPGIDTAGRRATAAARRLQDPLSELIKLDPRKLSLGQYQHEVEQEELRAALEQVVSSCVNAVAVDLNTAGADRLARVCGLSKSLAQAVVAHRDKAGPFRTRAQLLEVEGLAGKAFEQAAGSLRINDGENPLDRTTIHPERYGQITEMATDLGCTVGDLIGNAELTSKLEAAKYVGKPGMSGVPLGQPTFDDIVAQLREPGGDPRPPFEAIDYEPAVLSFAELTVGMELPGVVTHVAGFGAFIDVGLAQEGMVHVSELSHGFIDNPAEAVHVGQQVRGRVVDIDTERKRFGMSLRALLPKPERPDRPERTDARSDRPGGGKPGRGKPRKDDDDRGGRRDDRAGRGDRGADRGDRRGDGRKGGGPGGRAGARNDGPRREKEDRVLNFNMDLSALAERLKGG